MSRIGKKPIPVPAAVQATVTGQTVKVKGAKGELAFTLPDDLTVERKGNDIVVAPRDDSQKARALRSEEHTSELQSPC